LNSGCLNFRHKELIEGLDSNLKRNDELLRIVCRKSVEDYEKFLDCLLKTKQYYAAQLLGAVSEGISMLQEETMRNLEVNKLVLIELLDATPDLLGDLVCCFCITHRQKQFIEAASCKSEMNKRLLTAVMHCSQSDFANFIDCLRRHGQRHVCRIMQNNGVVVLAQIQFSDLQTYTAFIDQLCSRAGTAFYSVERFIDLSDYEIPLFASCIEVLGLKATGAHSIGLFFVYRTLSEYYCMYEMCYSGEMYTLCERVLAMLTGDHFVVHSGNLLWKMLPTLGGAQFVSLVTGHPMLSDVYRLLHETNVQLTTEIAFDVMFLPIELMELLMLKASCFLVNQYSRVTTYASVYSLLTISAVSRHWWHLMTSQKIQRTTPETPFQTSLFAVQTQAQEVAWPVC
jgi:hypothetical protein